MRLIVVEFTNPERDLRHARLLGAGLAVVAGRFGRRNIDPLTRLAAAILAGLKTVPVVVFDGLNGDEIARLESQDDENDEYHAPVPVLDVWAEYYRLVKEEGWSQQRIADAKRVDTATVSLRLKLFATLPQNARKATCAGTLDEGHLIAFDGVTCDITSLEPWLTTQQSQSELVAEILSKHRGSSEGVKPTVKVVREAAKRGLNPTELHAGVKSKRSGSAADPE